MDDPRIQNLTKLSNNVFFLLNRQQFQMQQVEVEQNRLKKSIVRSEPNHKKLEHMNQIREYQELLNQTSRQLDKQQEKLKKFIELHPDLQNIELYKQMDSVLNKTKYLPQEAEPE